MATRFPGLIPLLLGIALPGAAPAQETADTMVPGNVVTGETLRRAGATRLSDLLLLAGQWDVATVDGLTWHASPLGGSPFVPARWIVLVDGRRMDLDLFGSTGLNRLGIPLERIDYVELLDFPQLEAGRLTTEGIVHIHTDKPPAGPSGSGWFTTGSEIGDPGPFAFTPRATSNVDRNGHDVAVGLAYGAGNRSWFGAAALTSTEMIPTDQAIVDRYLVALGDRPRLEATVWSAGAGGRIGGGRHELAIRHSRVAGALGLSPFGTEIATRERFTQVGIAGIASVDQGRELSYDLSYSANRARERGVGFGPPLDWDARAIEARLELSQPTSPVNLAGVRLRRLAAHSTISLGTAYAAAGPASAAVTLGEGEVGLAAALGREWTVSARSKLEVALGYERTVRGEDNSIWAWTARGYPLLAESGAAFEVVGLPEAPERITADARWSFRPTAALTVQLRGLLRRSRNLSLERRRLHYVPEINSFEGAAGIVHGAGGELGGAGVEIGRATRGLTLRLAWWYRGVLGGDSLFREAWATVPRHGARATAEYVPVPGLELWLAASYRGGSRWGEFEPVESESGGRYSPELPAAATVDLAVQKWLWDGRLRGGFGVRNLFGAELRYHPAGATFAPAVQVQVEARLP